MTIDDGVLCDQGMESSQYSTSTRSTELLKHQHQQKYRVQEYKYWQCTGTCTLTFIVLYITQIINDHYVLYLVLVLVEVKTALAEFWKY